LKKEGERKGYQPFSKEDFNIEKVISEEQKNKSLSITIDK
jgi:hypothetical protein